MFEVDPQHVIMLILPRPPFRLIIFMNAQVCIPDNQLLQKLHFNRAEVQQHTLDSICTRLMVLHRSFLPLVTALQHCRQT
jgi:hypothetical protein